MHFTTFTAISALVGISTAFTCGGFSSSASINDAKTCASLLIGKGSQACTVNAGQEPQMCHQGTARVYGVSNNGETQTATCQDVGYAVSDIINYCSSGSSVSGTENASSNSELSVQLHG